MKELIVILVIALVTFRIAKSTALKFTAESDYLRRRNTWIALTIAGFLSGNFWIYALIAAPILFWAARKDTNPIGFYLFVLFVMPPVPIAIPVFDVTQLFTLDNYRLLAFCVLVPTALRARRVMKSAGVTHSRRTDYLLLASGVVQVVLFVQPNAPSHMVFHDTFTNLLRRIFLFVLDVLVGYYAVSRTCADRQKILDAQAAFCVAALMLALVGIFEHVRHWLLYQGLALRWNPEDANYILAYLLRGSWLRSQASAGHPLVLGFLLAIAFGFWTHLQFNAKTMRVRLTPVIIFWSGMVATFSRGAWLGALAIYMAHLAIRPKAFSRVVRGALVIIVIFALFSMSSSGEKLINSMPVIGGKADSSLIYRQRLFDRSVELIEAHPIFGDQSAMTEMEDLRQGQGIIDVVNTYIGFALFYGLVGLGLFLALILSALMGVYRSAKLVLPADTPLAYLGFNLVACMLGVMVMMADCSLIYGIQVMLYVLIALGTAYARYIKESRDGRAPVATLGIK